MKRILFFCFLCVSLLFAQKTPSSEKIVAKVGETVITKEMLMTVVNSKMSRNFFHGNIGDDKLMDLKKETLQTLIDRELIFQYAKKNDYAYTPEQLAEEEKKIIEFFGGTQRFEMALKRSQMSYDMFKVEMEKEKAMHNVYEAEVKKEYTNEDLQKYYDENKYKFKKPKSISVQLIYIKNDPTDSNGSQKAKTRIEEALQLIQSGEDFKEVATEYSDDKSRIKGGVIKNLHKGMIDQSVEKEAFALDVGEVSEIIERTTGFYLVKVTEKNPAVQLKFDDIKTKLATQLKSKYEKKALDALLEKLKSSTVIVNTLEDK